MRIHIPAMALGAVTLFATLSNASPTSVSATGSHPLVSGLPTAIIISFDPGFTKPPRRSAGPGLVSSVPRIRGLTRRLNHLRKVVGTYSCPADSGDQLRLRFLYHLHPGPLVIVSTSGCRTVTRKGKRGGYWSTPGLVKAIDRDYAHRRATL